MNYSTKSEETIIGAIDNLGRVTSTLRENYGTIIGQVDIHGNVKSTREQMYGSIIGKVNNSGRVVKVTTEEQKNVI